MTGNATVLSGRRRPYILLFHDTVFAFFSSCPGQGRNRFQGLQQAPGVASSLLQGLGVTGYDGVEIFLFLRAKPVKRVSLVAVGLAEVCSRSGPGPVPVEIRAQ